MDEEHQHIKSFAARHGIPLACVDGLRAHRARASAALSSSPSLQASTRYLLKEKFGSKESDMDNDGYSMVHAAVKEVGSDVKAYREKTAQEVQTLRDDVQGMRADLQSTQQVLAKIDANGGGGFNASAPDVGTVAASKLREDSSFAAAAETAERGMKPSQFSARVNVDSSIRAALTNVGVGQAGDTSIPTNPDRRGVVGPVLAPLSLLSVLPSRPTSSNTVEFVQLNATGDAEEQIKEGDEKAELEFSGALKKANIVTIAGHTTASKQVLADESALSQQIDRVIAHKVFSRLENQIINGPGGDGRINGLLNQATAFVPAIGETPADRIGEALVTMANEGYLPNLVVMNPMDWFRIQLTRKNDQDDEYVFGSPTMPVPPSLWNSRIVTNPNLAAGTALVIDTSFVTVLDREQMSISATNTHADYFIRNLVKILGELRAGLEVLDVKAVRKFALAPTGP
ncbi:phage major capsid protein [Stenotrophomonas sp.]|uniref:phage major capsid protein n=1 Tax=Stenotrophomonas sp. TaxID=69392 RepID=UPI0028AAC77E|nr:phage major capsid protein [Stenotrophomonas sp.]